MATGSEAPSDVLLGEGCELFVQFGGHDAGGQSVSWLTAIVRGGHLLGGHALGDIRFPEVTLEHLVESLSVAVDGCHEGLVLVEDLRDRDSHPLYGGTESYEGVVSCDDQSIEVTAPDAETDFLLVGRPGFRAASCGS